MSGGPILSPLTPGPVLDSGRYSGHPVGEATSAHCAERRTWRQSSQRLGVGRRKLREQEAGGRQKRKGTGGSEWTAWAAGRSSAMPLNFLPAPSLSLPSLPYRTTTTITLHTCHTEMETESNGYLALWLSIGAPAGIKAVVTHRQHPWLAWRQFRATKWSAWDCQLERVDRTNTERRSFKQSWPHPPVPVSQLAIVGEIPLAMWQQRSCTRPVDT